MLINFRHNSDYGKGIDLFDNGLGGVFWSAKDVCKVLGIEDANKIIAEIDPEDKTEALVLPNENETNDTTFVKLPRKVNAINYRALFHLMFRSQAPIAKKFQKFVNDQIFFEMFLHWSPYFSENGNEDINADYESLMEDLKVQLGVWG